MKAPVILFLGLFAAAPAGATGGLICRTAGPRPIEISMAVSHTIVPTILSARVRESGRAVVAYLAQAWLDPAELRLDLVDGNAMRRELRLRAVKKGVFYDGAIWRKGQRRWVRCREG